MQYNPFRNRHKFQDDVWGQIRLNDLERDVIDTPEFQRLFRTSQLGFVKMVYHAANHTRGAHSIGACHLTNSLIDRLVENTADLHDGHSENCPGLYANFRISPAERILIRLGALLHDVSHVPLSHDLEKKSHKIFYENGDLKLRSWYGHYDKHDDYQHNPLLYTLIFDSHSSVLARVLRFYSAEFWKRLELDSGNPEHIHLQPFVNAVSEKTFKDWRTDQDLLPELLFHLLFFETPIQARKSTWEIAVRFDGPNRLEKWHLGSPSLSEVDAEKWHELWYQPFRHDIIGNTLSADLIDYLTRDPKRLGTRRRIDLHLLSYYALVNPDPSANSARYRCAIDLQDHKRSTTRTFLVNDVFRLLDLRQDIHEKAVVHRVVQAANAMLARGLLLLGNEPLGGPDCRPSLKELTGLGRGQFHALQSEDLLFSQLLAACQCKDDTPVEVRRRLSEARKIFEKLTERRIYRPLVVISGDWAREKHILPKDDDGNKDYLLRTLAAIVDSAYYSPFLLFVSSCIEKYLEGIFDTDKDLLRFLMSLADRDVSDPLISRAYRMVPSRVVIWTIPYKQLYKDPAAVVAIGGCVDQIDELAENGAIKDKATRERLLTAIQGADSKYASLWHLYVFISDGLYYRGMLNKLLRHLAIKGIAAERDDHLHRLEKSQAYLSLAIKQVCDDWDGLNSHYAEIENKKSLLDDRMGADQFQAMIRGWSGTCMNETSWPANLSTVAVTHYFHEYMHDASVELEQKLPCRDNRYKFDRPARTAWDAPKTQMLADERALLDFLEQCGITDPNLLSEREFENMVDVYSNAETRELCNELMANSQRDPNAITDALKTLWVQGFPWIGEPRATDVLPTKELFPDSQEEVRDWLLTECRVLRPNVRRRLTEELDPVIEVLRAAGRIHGRNVLEDFELRLRNESALLWNDVRCDRITSALKRRWKL